MKMSTQRRPSACSRAARTAAPAVGWLAGPAPTRRPVYAQPGTPLAPRGERPPLLRQRVLDAHRRLRDDRPHDDPLRLQLLQTLREHPVAEARDRLREVGEALDAAEEGAQHGARPAAADQLNRAVIVRAERAQGMVCPATIITQSKLLDKC